MLRRRPSGPSILVAAYHRLDRRQLYHDLGGDCFVQRNNKEAHVRRLVRQLERFSHQVTLEPIDTAA
jgi:transposase